MDCGSITLVNWICIVENVGCTVPLRHQILPLLLPPWASLSQHRQARSGINAIVKAATAWRARGSPVGVELENHTVPCRSPPVSELAASRHSSVLVCRGKSVDE